jgi:PII-like signaling protein
VTVSGFARRLVVIVDEDATINRRPVYDEIVKRAQRARLAGASVFRGIAGFGQSGRLHTSRTLSLAQKLPVMIVIIDNASRIDGFLPQLAALGVRGVIAIDDVEVVQPGQLPQAAQP